MPAQLQSPQVPRDPRRRPTNIEETHGGDPQTLEITIHATQSIELEPKFLPLNIVAQSAELLNNPKPKIFNPKFPTKMTHKHRK